jgi:hypothetical protein
MKGVEPIAIQCFIDRIKKQDVDHVFKKISTRRSQ